MRCRACNKDMKADSGDEYWRKVKAGKENIQVLEDLCKDCRKMLHMYDKKMVWKIYNNEMDFLSEYDDLLTVDQRHVEGRRPSYPDSDEV